MSIHRIQNFTGEKLPTGLTLQEVQNQGLIAPSAANMNPTLILDFYRGAGTIPFGYKSLLTAAAGHRMFGTNPSTPERERFWSDVAACLKPGRGLAGLLEVDYVDTIEEIAQPDERALLPTSESNTAIGAMRVVLWTRIANPPKAILVIGGTLKHREASAAASVRALAPTALESCVWYDAFFRQRDSGDPKGADWSIRALE